MSLPTTLEHKGPDVCRISCDYNFLRQSEMFAGAPPEIIKLFAYLAKHKTYQPGEKIITLNEKADGSFFLVSGEVEISTIHHDQDVTIQRLHTGAFFGELSLLARFKWFFDATATETTELIVINRESFRKLLEQFPDHRDNITEKIIQLRVSRLQEQTTYMLDRCIETGRTVQEGQ